VRNPRLTSEEREEAAEAAVEEACKLLRPLTKPARSWGIVNWSDPDAANDPRDEFEAAIEFVIALLDPADSRARQAADEFLGAHSPIAAPIVRKVVLPALRLGRLPKQKGPHGLLLRDRWIAAVVTTICQRYGLRPYRNQANKREYNGCAIVAKALGRLGINITEETVRQIYMRHNKQA
jgi:hypothetical protein